MFLGDRGVLGGRWRRQKRVGVLSFLYLNLLTTFFTIRLRIHGRPPHLCTSPPRPYVVAPRDGETGSRYASRTVRHPHCLRSTKRRRKGLETRVSSSL